MEMPVPDPALLAKKDELTRRLTEALGPDGVISADAELKAYECDALTAYRCPPLAVALPRTTEEVAAAVRICRDLCVPIVPRGAGTSLAGGSLPTADSVLLGVARLNEVLEIDTDNRFIRVQTGMTNLSVTGAVQDDGFFYAPDPSSQLACAIAGNIAMNSGGAHCLKYGVTTNNLMGVKFVTAEGEIVEIGGAHLDAAGYDLLGLICGSEGQLGIVTEATLRILAAPEGARPVLMGFDSSETAGACVADIIRSGVIPVAIEFMDRTVIHAAEKHASAGYPLDVEALLIVEVEGSDAEIAEQLETVKAIAQTHNPMACARRAPPPSRPPSGWAANPPSAPWARWAITSAWTARCRCRSCRRSCAAPPKSRRKYGLPIGNVFHAGDGNMHPLIIFRRQQAGRPGKWPNRPGPRSCASASRLAAA